MYTCSCRDRGIAGWKIKHESNGVLGENIGLIAEFDF